MRREEHTNKHTRVMLCDKISSHTRDRAVMWNREAATNKSTTHTTTVTIYKEKKKRKKEREKEEENTHQSRADLEEDEPLQYRYTPKPEKKP